MTAHDMDEKIIKLETKLAFLEDFLMQLQEVSVEQGKEIEQLKTENKKIHTKIKEMLENEELLNVRPPHY